MTAFLSPSVKQKKDTVPSCQWNIQVVLRWWIKKDVPDVWKKHSCCFMSVNRGLFAGILAGWWRMCMCREEACDFSLALFVCVWERETGLCAWVHRYQISVHPPSSAVTLTFSFAINNQHDENPMLAHNLTQGGFHWASNFMPKASLLHKCKQIHTCIIQVLPLVDASVLPGEAERLVSSHSEQGK